MENAAYEGSPNHKKNPGDFGLTPPAAPRPHKTLCDEANVTSLAEAKRLFRLAITRGMVGDKSVGSFPKNLWVVDGSVVFEAMIGGSQMGKYHGYPIRKADPFYEEILDEWSRRREQS